jgi:quercetin dioxygenase-like cupin family protein
MKMDPENFSGGLPPGEAVPLEPLLSTVPGAVVSRTLAKHAGGSVTLFSFDTGQALSEHTAPFDAFVTILSGSVEVTVGGRPVTARSGETVFMPSGVPHALRALEAFKMYLVMLRKG